jgi:lipopolysaccharide transport system permease protein
VSTVRTSEPVVEIAAPRGLTPLNLRELWEYRELVYFFLWRDVKARYRQMALGPLWIVIHPVLNMVLFTLIFSVVAKLPSDGVPYPLFNFAALLPWGFFTAALFAAAGSLMNYRNLISKVYFPRLSVPLVGVLSGLVDFFIAFVVLLGMTLFYGYALRWTLLMIPVYLLLAGMTALAVGLWTACAVVYFHDVLDALGYLAKLWMFVSPVVYASSLVPGKWQTLYYLNPMAVVVDGCRWALLGAGRPPDLMLLLSFLLVLPFLVSGAYYFRKTERSIVDVA